MKKNPLNDLDQFLQQEASSIVAPASLRDKLKQPDSETTISSGASVEEQLLQMAKQNPQHLYDVLISVGEKMDVIKNTMLINTALYLRHGEHWKEAVREYWKE